MSYPLYGNVIVDSSNGAALGGTLTISNSCKTSVVNNQASIAFAIADISYGALNKGFFSNNVDSADARITAMIDKVSPTVGTAMTFKVSSDHASEPIEALRIASNGNVGIGTQTPLYPLDVTGNIRLGIGTTGNIRFGTTEAGYVDLINNNMTIMNKQNGSLVLGTNNGEDMRILSSGNVGIGTQTPAYPLDVTGNIRLGIGTTGNIRFGTSGVGATQAGYVDLINNNMTIMNQQNGSLVLGTNNGEDMRILSNGYVGINTTNPIARLHVISSGQNVETLRISDVINNSVLRFIGNLSVGGFSSMSQNNDIGIIYGVNTSTTRGLIIAPHNDALGGIRMDQKGNVGIGTTNPQTRLHVNYNGIANGMISENCISDIITAGTQLDGIATNSIIGPSPNLTQMFFFWKQANGTKYRYSVNGITPLFTGQHMVVPDNSDLKTNLTEYVGLIVSSNDSGYTSYYNGIKSTGIDAINICEALPNCKLSDKDNDKAVFGVITNEKNDEFDTDGSPIYDNIDNGFEKGLYDRIRVNSVGEGSMWVTNINGNIENGHYITSSAIPGYGKRQNDDLLHNYTVAKSTMSCDFILDSPNYKTKSVIWDGNTYIAAFIGCTYHCG